MKKFTHRLLSILLTLAMVITIMPAVSVSVFATADVCYIDKDGDGFTEGTDEKYSTVQAAVTAAGTTPTAITMIANSTEKTVTILSDYNDDGPTTPNDAQTITLDLNGYVLCGTGNDSVINNFGMLTIKDSNTDNQTHYFKVNENTNLPAMLGRIE